MQGATDFSADLVLAAVELLGRAGREGLMRVQGRSMSPTLTPGQLLLVEFSPDELARGDMLVFRQASTVLVHRLLGDARRRGGPRRLRTRGDGVPNLDTPVDLEHVMGRVEALEHGGGWVTVRSPGARAYAWCVAWHGLFWAAVAVVVRYPERKLRKIRVRVPFRTWVAAVDRTLLAVVHRLLFRWMHRKVPRPESLD